MIPAIEVRLLVVSLFGMNTTIRVVPDVRAPVRSRRSSHEVLRVSVEDPLQGSCGPRMGSPGREEQEPVLGHPFWRSVGPVRR